MFVYYTKVLLVFLCITSLEGIDRFFERNVKKTNTFLPKCKDFGLYMAALENATNYCISLGDKLEDSDIDIGLLFVKVNLELAMKLRVRKQVRQNLLHLWGNVKYLVGSESALEIYPFHEYLLVINLPKLNANQFTSDVMLPPNGITSYPAIPSVRRRFNSTNDYIKGILDVSDVVQGEITTCFNLILASSRPPSPENGTCDDIRRACYDLIRKGPYFGFALTARLAQMMFIKYTSPCYLFSAQEDEHIIKTMCAAIFKEAEYIVKRDYFYISLLAEQVALCLQNGYLQFLNRAWLKKLLELQVPDQYCYWNPISELEIMNVKEKEIMCDLHLTGMAMSILSYAVRYILEKCYIV